MNLSNIIAIGNVKCPECGNTEKVMMPRYASKTYYQCPACKYVFQSNKKDCCVFCAIGDTPCPKSQSDQTPKTIN